MSELQPHKYIPLSDTEAWLQKLDQVYRERRICLISGPPGSGKTALINYWLGGRQVVPSQPGLPTKQRATWITLKQPGKRNKTARRMIEEALEEEIEKRGLPQYMSSWYRPGRKQSRRAAKEPTRFLEGLQDHRIQMIVIDKAQHLSADALNYVLTFIINPDENECTPVRMRSLILLETIDLDDTKSKLLNRLKNNSDALAAMPHPPDPVILSRLTKETFPGIFSALIRNNLLAEVATDEHEALRKQRQRELQAEIMYRTQGNWHRIPVVIASMHKHLGPWDGENPRRLTIDVMEAVMEDLAEMARQGMVYG